MAVGADRAKVEIPGKGGWLYNPDVLTKVEKSRSDSSGSNSSSTSSSSSSSGTAEISVGDLVRVSSDAGRVRLLQRGHGGWNDRMLEVG